MLKNNEELSFPFFFLFLGMSSWCCVNPCWFCESEFDFMGGVLLYRWWWKYLEDVNSFFYINSNKFYHHCSCLGIPFGLFASLKLMNVLPLYRVKNVLLFSSHNGSHDTCTHISPTHWWSVCGEQRVIGENREKYIWFAILLLKNGARQLVRKNFYMAG